MATRKGSTDEKSRSTKSTSRARKRAGDGNRGKSAKGASGGARKMAASRGRKSTGRAASGGREGASRKRASETRGRAAAGRGRAPRMNAIAMLKEDHDRVQEMFDKFERARSDDQKQQLADRICEELTIHAQVEEEIFYPAVREAAGEDDLVDEAEVEHASAKMLIAQIQDGKVGDPQWEAKVKVLGEYVRHHIKEEQREMFPKARAAKLDLRELGERIAERKEGGAMPEVRASAAAMAGGDMGNADESREREPGLIETAVRTLLPGK